METILLNSPIGQIAIEGSTKGITCVILDCAPSLSISESKAPDFLIEAKEQILDYFNGTRTTFSLPIDWETVKGFQRDVLTLTSSIPFGEVWTYGQIAARLGKPNASRAVGGALSRNPFPIIVPCHRVVASTGALTGYTGAKGIETKKFLLEKEGHKVVAQKLV